MPLPSILSLAGVTTFALLFATPVALAAQQGGPTVEVEPAAVPAPGPVELTVTGTGWTAPPPILIVECTTPASNELSDLNVDNDCDTSTIEAVTPDDAGNFEVVVTFNVTADGLIVAASDVTSNLLLTEIMVSLDEGGEGADEDELARTGFGSDAVLVVAVTLLAAGAIASGASRIGPRRPAP